MSILKAEDLYLLMGLAPNPNPNGCPNPNSCTGQNKCELVILDASNLPSTYTTSHIPGSLYINWKTDLADALHPEGLYELPKKEAFQQTLRNLGIKESSKIVLYDDFNNRLAIRGLFVLEYFGHKDVSILENGRAGWLAAGYPMTAAGTSVTTSCYVISEQKTSVIVGADYMKKYRTNKDVTIIDSRPFSHYYGWDRVNGVPVVGTLIQSGVPVARPGHLPNAINKPWAFNLVGNNTTSTGVFKEVSELQQQYSDLLADGKKIVFYCNEGVHAVFNWFVLTKILGYQDVVVYEGSMGEWALAKLHPELPSMTCPMVTGYDVYPY